MFKISDVCLKLITLVGMAGFSIMADAVIPVTIDTETPQYILDIKYPKGFQSEGINSEIKKEIEGLQASFKKELAEDTDVPPDAPGKTGLTITYSIPYQSDKALSVRLNVSIYHRGAAHPSNKVLVVNFINGHRVELSDLFVSGSDYLKPIADYCYKHFMTKQFSDQNWIQDGTKPTVENYNTWFFTQKGIAIVFNSYQVAAYVYGEQEVPVSLSIFTSMIKPEVLSSVWGN